MRTTISRYVVEEHTCDAAHKPVHLYILDNIRWKTTMWNHRNLFFFFVFFFFCLFGSSSFTSVPNQRQGAGKDGRRGNITGVCVCYAAAFIQRKQSSSSSHLPFAAVAYYNPRRARAELNLAWMLIRWPVDMGPSTVDWKRVRESFSCTTIKRRTADVFQLPRSTELDNSHSVHFFVLRKKKLVRTQTQNCLPSNYEWWLSTRKCFFLFFLLNVSFVKVKWWEKNWRKNKRMFSGWTQTRCVCVCLRSGIGMIVAMSWSAGVFWFARLPDWGYFELIYVTVGIRIGGLFCQSPKVRRTERAQQGVDTTRTVGERREPAGRADNLSASTVLSTGHFYQ